MLNDLKVGDAVECEEISDPVVVFNLEKHTTNKKIVRKMQLCIHLDEDVARWIFDKSWSSGCDMESFLTGILRSRMSGEITPDLMERVAQRWNLQCRIE